MISSIFWRVAWATPWLSVAWFKDFMSILFYLFPCKPDHRNFLSVHFNTIIEITVIYGGVIPYKITYLYFCFYFVAVFVTFASSWCFFTGCSFCLCQAFFYKTFYPKSIKNVPLYYNWKSIKFTWYEIKFFKA